MSNKTAMTAVEVPEDVRDNSETVTDYAFMRHRFTISGIHTVAARDAALKWADRNPPSSTLGSTVYSWLDENPDGQRCRFDMIVNRDGEVVHLFHTEYWTRVACGAGDWCHSYASYYVREDDPREEIEDPRPFCDEHTAKIISAPLMLGQDSYIRDDGIVVRLSERLLVGQH